MGEKTYGVLCEWCADNLNYLLVGFSIGKCQCCNKRKGKIAFKR